MARLFTVEEDAFRLTVRTFLDDKLPADLRERMLSGERPTREDKVTWSRLLHERGWGGYTWPAEHGGPGFSPIQRYIFEDEAWQAGAPEVVPFGLKMVAPVIMKFGSDAQKKRFLPRIASLEDYWCQGYSEPGSGSDLASLKTRAVRDGDDYLVTGQKIWTTEAHDADWIFCLVRTASDGRKQDGISFLLIDMKTPGITVRPIITFDGAHEVNEVWFDNVRVPVANRIGEEGQGWTCAKYLLEKERLNFGGMGFCKREVARLKRLAQTNGKSRLDNPLFAARVAALEMRIAAADLTNLRFLRAEERGDAVGLPAPYLKILSSHLQQDVLELQVRLLGRSALPVRAADLSNTPLALDSELANVAPTYCNYRKTTIYAGSNEIQRNIAAKSLLG
ncbi:alkylation response protein AidB-like acyl-CoA dehydrogenase [Afipia massiliensis]|uniref:Alkylation response protein AidB-like acyl-CoA dehydrogenase n=1 Tax=Afipia massiliensis TaxID=211460 RepID=A0A840N8E0_9BRAD|nr:acyl-CoA dehydrogenase family protein [Afipia massiliensis]MBB5054068.1 alkylation response protein AidB-like acyl-CoA dehydrogenase [Afipia massiliensis]